MLVDGDDKVIGFGEKFVSHKNPVPLHRAISVLIFDPSRKNMLLQMRAKGKPTWPLFWSNTCCTHPYPDESYEHCASRRLKEELGIATPLTKLFPFIYKAKYDDTWGEYEYDVVFEGVYDGKITANPQEVADYKWVPVRQLLRDVRNHPQDYTPWLKIILTRLTK